MPFEHIKTIFAPVLLTDEGDLEPALKLAGSLAQASGAHVIARVLGVEVPRTYSPLSSVAANYVGEANEAMKKRADARARDAAHLLGGHAQSVDCLAHTAPHGILVDEMLMFGRLSDLSVVNRSTGRFDESGALLETLLFESGRPVLVTPPQASEFRARNIVVAWDGSSRAARAVADAMPLLRAADRVVIVCVTNEKDLRRPSPGTDLADALARHAIRPEVNNLSASDRNAARAIREHAVAVQADLVVMGAFAHSRLRQMVLGGVTDSMLRDAEIPLFMSY
ncbi:universal stress protein [Phreatobacter sp. AB_2022a]|uniref:universal stress protein n=1 Tax=Phreatobacter sp. AB_2022a TaxID=3003134 RepID=UPI00228732B0|nr:universal stress protein [Phreatobacter sp. AB_2022a]MCZ0737929.1 universal stress protein [Phreatobacter sp. AB_2022a]